MALGSNEIRHRCAQYAGLGAEVALAVERRRNAVPLREAVGGQIVAQGVVLRVVSRSDVPPVKQHDLVGP